MFHKMVLGVTDPAVDADDETVASKKRSARKRAFNRLMTTGFPFRGHANGSKIGSKMGKPGESLEHHAGISK